MATPRTEAGHGTWDMGARMGDEGHVTWDVGARMRGTRDMRHATCDARATIDAATRD